MFNKKRLITAAVLVVATITIVIVVGTVAAVFFLNSSGDSEMVFAATEVGTPEGDKVTKNIGPAGGTLTSPDGRMTLTVPQGALTETIAFSMQPITNKAGNGLGLAYRLEPDGKTFTTPLEISVRYDEKDLEGTVPEALSIAYQDKQGAWHVQQAARLDQAAKTLTFSTTHFTDVAFLARLRLIPSEAAVKVGTDFNFISLRECREGGLLDRIRSRPPDCVSPPVNIAKWKLRGEGALRKNVHGTGVIYTAPVKKPTPNFAWVVLTVEFEVWEPTTGGVTRVSREFAARITILGHGYRAWGETADVKYSGVICDLEKPFTVFGTYPSFKASFNFVPSSSTAGTASYVETPGVQTSTGAGTYTIERSDTDSPMIVWTLSMNTVVPRAGSHSDSGTTYIHLIPHFTDECK